MILATDVYYEDKKAKAVGVLFNDWKDEVPSQIIAKHIGNVENYESGNFYKRELPCLIQLLEDIDLKKINTIIVDGYVFLDDAKKHGLGYYLYEYLNKAIAVIGVAKKAFHNNSLYVVSLLRGTSKNPLYITAVGINLSLATECIKSMHGEFRIPTLLKFTDQQTRMDMLK
jgi:deoxyribonuclease V